jgi:hypothetical protein
VDLTQLIRFLVVKLIHLDLIFKFNINITFTTNYSLSSFLPTPQTPTHSTTSQVDSRQAGLHHCSAASTAEQRLGLLHQVRAELPSPIL